MLINVGYGNIVNMDKVVQYCKDRSSTDKRMIQVAKDSNMAIDATCGRKTKCILIMDSGHIVLSALLPDTIENRVNENQNREEQSQ